jgi:hypothetical protein
MTRASGAGAGPWKGIPMPPAVRRLPRTSSGMPVVYITDYLPSDRDVDPSYSSADGMIDCDCELGSGRPVIGKQCPRRQRKAMAERLCNVCGQPVGARGWFAGAATMNVDGEPWWYSLEAPTHTACLAYSALTCPHMYQRPGVFPVVAAGDYTVVDTWRTFDGGRKYVDHGTPRPRLGAGLHLAMLEFHMGLVPARLTTKSLLDSWMREHAPEKYRSLWAERFPAPIG